MFSGQKCGEKSQKKTKKNSVFCDSTRKVPHAVWAVFEEKSDSEHPKTQQRDRKIGQTCEAKSEAQCEYRLYRWCCLQKGWKQESERSKKKEADFRNLWGVLGSLWGTLGGDLGEALGRLRERFFDETCLIFIIIE